MVLYQNNRFHFGNVSLSLPDNIYLDNLEEVIYGFGLELTPLDQSYRITIHGDDRDLLGRDFFEQFQEAQGFHWLGDVTPFIHNGICGCFLLYESERAEYCEFLFDLDDVKLNTLDILFYCKKVKTYIRTVMREKAVRDLLNSIQ